jgi:hypothetical protein
VNSIHGYRVVTHDGRTIGTIAGESDAALVVKCGRWPRKVLRALPRRYASIQDDQQRVLVQVSRHDLSRSPQLRRHAPVDDGAVASWWGIA